MTADTVAKHDHVTGMHRRDMRDQDLKVATACFAWEVRRALFSLQHEERTRWNSGPDVMTVSFLLVTIGESFAVYRLVAQF